MSLIYPWVPIVSIFIGIIIIAVLNQYERLKEGSLKDLASFIKKFFQ